MKAVFFGLVFVPLAISAQSSLGILDLVAKQGVSKADASALTDFVYDAAYKLGKEKYTIIARNQRDAVLAEHEFSLSDACDEQKCALQVGEYLAADYVIAGAFQKFGGKYYVFLMMVNVSTTEVEGTARYSATDYDGIEQSVNDGVDELFGLTWKWKPVAIIGSMATGFSVGGYLAYDAMRYKSEHVDPALIVYLEAPVGSNFDALYAQYEASFAESQKKLIRALAVAGGSVILSIILGIVPFGP